MVEWLEQVSQLHEMYCHDLEVMSSNPGRVELVVHSTSVLILEPKNSFKLDKYVTFSVKSKHVDQLGEFMQYISK